MALSLSNAQRDLEEQVEQATHQLVKTVKDLERSESEYRNIVDNASDIVFTLNDQLQLLQTNPAMETLTGRSHLELVGEFFTALLQQDQRTRIEQLYSHQLVALTPMVYETVIDTPAGELITLEISSRAQMRDEKCIGFHGVARDITARQRAEQARSEAQQLAETANNAKAVFLASVSHEIRSPMNGILGFLNLLNKTSLSETQSEYISTAQRSATNLTRIVDDLLEIQRREAGYHDFRPEPVELNAFLEHIVAESAQNMDNSNVDIVTAFDPALPRTVLTDPARLNQVLTNIIGNACKFTEAGSVIFSVDCIDSADTSATLVFGIRDSGPGFSQEHLDDVLEPFGRSPDAIDNKVAGVGLGLAIAKSLVDGMAGRLTVGNHPAGGAEVTVTLSLLTATDTNFSADETVASASVPQQVRKSQASEIEGTLKALVVDDSEINTRFVTTLLGYYGVLTHAANSGAKAVQLCETTRFDVVIMDLHMPEMNGIETANRIGNLVGEQCPPIIALTADATADSARKLLQSGFDGVLFKPASESDLISTIARCTGHNFETSEKPQPLVEAQSTEHSSALNQRRGLELAGGDMDLWETNVRLFVKDLRSNLALFERPSTDVDRAQLESYCHRVTGSAAYIGANDIESTALAIDRDCKSLSASELEKRCDLFLAAADEFLNLAERSGWLDETAA